MFRADTNVLFECYKAKAIDRCVTGLYCHRVWQRRETKPHHGTRIVHGISGSNLNLTRYNASETLSSKMMAMTLSEDTLFKGFSCPTEVRGSPEVSGSRPVNHCAFLWLVGIGADPFNAQQGV